VPYEQWPTENKELLLWLNVQLLALPTPLTSPGSLGTPTPPASALDPSWRVKSLHADLRTGVVLIDLVEVRAPEEAAALFI